MVVRLDGSYLGGTCPGLAVQVLSWVVVSLGDACPRQLSEWQLLWVVVCRVIVNLIRVLLLTR